MGPGVLAGLETQERVTRIKESSERNSLFFTVNQPKYKDLAPQCRSRIVVTIDNSHVRDLVSQVLFFG
jgi:hypothetical protein